MPEYDRILTPGGYALINPSPDPAHRQQVSQARAQLGKVTGRRANFTIHPPTPAGSQYQVPARRTLDQCRAELAKLDASGETGTSAHTSRGQTIIPGYVVTMTDGCWAWGVPGERDARRQLLPEPVILGALPAEAWRDYAPVRVLAGERNGAVAWRFENGRVSWEAKGGYREWEGSGWSPFIEYPAAIDAGVVTITLRDDQLWACRGLSWRVGICYADKPIPGGPMGAAKTMPAIVLYAADGSGILVAMGMRI